MSLPNTLREQRAASFFFYEGPGEHLEKTSPPRFARQPLRSLGWAIK
jgi:hypothetical protein